MQEENQTDNNSTGTAPVLNISGFRRSRFRNKQKQIANVEPKFNFKEFPLILSRIMLKSDSPANSNANNINYKYLGVLCLKNIKTSERLYHMFYTTDKNIGKDYEETRLLYKNKPEIKAYNNVTVQTISPESLHRSAVKHFTECTWNKDGNVLVTPISESDEWIMSNKLHDLHKKQVLKLCNYIAFLKMRKV